jgi:ribonucleoside-triphosphate reductase
LNSLSFRLPDDFVDNYVNRTPPWGFPIGAGNSLGELTFISKYSRRKPDGTKERWFEVCRRVVEGYHSILKDHCVNNRTPWNEKKAQRSAKDAFERMYTFKWLPPGRGLWMMGTEFVHAQQNSAPLQNCSFLSTEGLSPASRHEAILPFVRLMEMSMLGVGVGFDTKGADKLTIHQPLVIPCTDVVEDSREGWYNSVGRLLESYFFSSRPTVTFDYTQIRPAGEPIKGFGGIAAGAGPLVDLHGSIRRLFAGRHGQKVSSTDIVDLMNLIGKCVVSGNVRRSAEIALGEPDDQAFLDLKNPDVNPERMGPNGWGYTSNNSVFAEVGGNYDHLADSIAVNGEPGLLYLDLCRLYGRLADPVNNRDYRVAGTNPCSEQSLESFECCTLVETFPVNCHDLGDWIATLKHAYLYGKAVTLMPTHWPETNEVMQRNRRIGCSVSGMAQFAEAHSFPEMKRWLDAGYAAVVSRDVQYSEWLGVRESIKRTSVKPSGTVSLLAGVTPGVHWPVSNGTYLRRVRYSVTDPILEVLVGAGYHVEPDVMDPKHTMVVTFPTLGPKMRSERDVSVWEKAHLASAHQRHWADNQVSVTLTFKENERDQIPAVLRAFDGQLKSVSLLPMLEADGPYAQAPYEHVTDGQWQELASSARPLDWPALYGGAARDAEGESFCTNDTCEVPK